MKQSLSRKGWLELQAHTTLDQPCTGLLLYSACQSLLARAGKAQRGSPHKPSCGPSILCSTWPGVCLIITSSRGDGYPQIAVIELGGS